ncbi:uncharacterized protein [Dermacentor albipictus]|uniref:uncharacterized protein isoform X2 n=1 Tax=Dermacentor albipictus TaxID=60249 RepID=UPI0038FCEF2D
MEVGSRFDSFLEFERAFREFQVRNNALFVTKASKKTEVVNARLSSGLKRLDPKLKFANATYVCKHGGELRCTGTGIRPRQRTMKQNCPATVVIAARRETQQLEVTKVDCNHSHEVSNELFQSYPENRRLTDEEKNYALPLMELNVLPSVIAGKLNEKTVLLTGIAVQDATRRVLEKGCRLDESEVEVRPELLPSALLDCNVCLPKIKKFFTPDAWLSLMSSIATKKQEELWLCGQCKRKDDGEIKMISCDRCLEWFHWPCVQVKKQDIGRLWFCPGCSLSV